MCSIKPLYELEISEARMDKALALIQRVAKPTKNQTGLSLDVVLEVFHQLGWADCISYVPNDPQPEERLKLNLTDVQYVALAAALAAVAETGGRMIRSEVQGTPDTPAVLPPEPEPAPIIVAAPIEVLDMPTPVQVDVLDLFADQPLPSSPPPLTSAPTVAPADDLFAGLPPAPTSAIELT